MMGSKSLFQVGLFANNEETRTHTHKKKSILHTAFLGKVANGILDERYREEEK